MAATTMSKRTVFQRSNILTYHCRTTDFRRPSTQPLISMRSKCAHIMNLMFGARDRVRWEGIRIISYVWRQAEGTDEGDAARDRTDEVTDDCAAV